MMHLRNILAAFALAFCGSARAVEIQDMTELAAAPASGDLLVIVDVSDTTDDAAGTGKRITTANLAGYMYGTAGTFTAAQTFQIADAGTTTVVYPLIVDHQSSGTPANGQGVGLAFDVETSAANTERGATIEAVTTDVTGASEDFALVAKTMVAGSTTLVEGGRFVGAQFLVPDGSAASPSIGRSNASGNRSGIYFGTGSVSLSGNGGNAGTFGAASTVLPGYLTGAGYIKGFGPEVAAASTSTISSAQIGRVYVNSSGAATLTLPSAAANYIFDFYVVNASAFRIAANTGDTIRVIDKVTASAGYIESSTVGSAVRIVAVDSTQWVAMAIHGVWTDGTFTYDDTANTTP